MASSANPCDSCGSPIPDSDLETGNAITLLGLSGRLAHYAWTTGKSKGAAEAPAAVPTG